MRPASAHSAMIIVVLWIISPVITRSQWLPLTVPATNPTFEYSGGWYIAATSQGVYRTRQFTDATTWQFVEQSPSGISTLVTYSGRVYGMGRTSFSVSSDHGATWTRLEEWPRPIQVKRLISTASALIMQRTADIIRTFDGGSTWDTVALPKPDSSIIITGPDLYLMTNGKGYYYHNHLWSTKDHGRTWLKVADDLPGYFTDLWVGPSGRLYAYGEGMGIFGYSPDFYISYNDGQSFEDQNNDIHLEPFAIAEIGNRTVFCGATGGSNFLFGDWYELGTWDRWGTGTWERSSGSPGGRVASLTTVHNFVVAKNEQGDHYARLDRTVSVDETDAPESSVIRCQALIDRGFDRVRVTIPQCMGPYAFVEVYSVLGQRVSVRQVPCGATDLEIPPGTLVRVTNAE